MPRKRRVIKARLPAGLREISSAERSMWSSLGPVLATDEIEGAEQVNYHVWASWDVFFGFYSEVRHELFWDRPWLVERSIAERLFEGWLRGVDLEVLREELLASRPDPRVLLRDDLYATKTAQGKVTH